VAAANPNTVVVLNCGAPVEMVSAATVVGLPLARIRGQVGETEKETRVSLFGVSEDKGYKSSSASCLIAARLEMPRQRARKLMTSWMPWAGQSGRLQPHSPV
jgi:hypothetical protein